MTQSNYHKRLIEKILNFGEEMNNKYISAHKGAVTPLYLLHPQAKRKKNTSNSIRTRCIFYL